MGQWGKSKCQRENLSKLSTTFLVLFTQTFITARNWLSWLLHGDAQGMEAQNSNWRSHHFLGKRILTPWASKNPKTSTHSNMHPHFHVFLTIPLHVGLLEVAGTSCMCIHSRFLLFTSFSSGLEIGFAIISGWVPPPRFCYIFPLFRS